jgi:hypothetical protein
LGIEGPVALLISVNLGADLRGNVPRQMNLTIEISMEVTIEMVFTW